ncbi:MAG: hypothetical protein CVU57_27515 [Deltaproteobacteria bacterium HGW-Deltaproteobacteria-15]|nr:MAG: hypothetical protein CVU57_27515 [Deltaproteobacteria bacterium HGW-Deltaproteobacteria-15]
MGRAKRNPSGKNAKGVEQRSPGENRGFFFMWKNGSDTLTLLLLRYGSRKLLGQESLGQSKIASCTGKPVFR